MFYDRFIQICDERNVTPSQVALKCGFNKSSVTNWKKNGYAPRQEILIKISNYFNVSVDYLLGNEEKENTTVSDSDIKVALFGGDAEVISETAWNDVKTFAQRVAEIERKKKEYNDT